jgi:hypothetical protein
MGIKRILGIVCLAIAAGLLVMGIITVSRGPGIANPSGLGISHAVGAFLPAFLVLILGLWLFKKPKQS